MTVMEDEDLEKLDVKPARLLPTPKGAAAKPNPLARHLEKTWDEPWGVQVPAKDAPGIEAKLRKTAMRMGYGVTVQFQVGPEDAYISGAKVRELDPIEKVRVVFQIREKGQAARREDEDE
jgi:hypothetical protein